jgi:hypothetical protein
MMRWLDRLNLQPQERRWLLAGLVVIALVLNYWLVWPYFAEWKQVDGDSEKLTASRLKYFGEIGKKAGYETKLKELQKAGAEVLQDNQANQLQSIIQSLAGANGVTAGTIRPVSVPVRIAGQTNSFFDEQLMTVDVSGGEQEVVNFLYALGASDSMVRVRDMSRLTLDPSKTRLQTTLTVVASFQKKPKPVAVAAQPSRPGVVQPKGPAPTNTAKATPKK